MVLVREACASLSAAFAAMREAQQAGRGMTDTVLTGERAAWRGGAQDVRSVFGRDDELAPFTVPVAEPVDPLRIYLAVRHRGYWAEGFAVLSRAPRPAMHAAAAVLDAAIGLARPGTPHRDVARILAHELTSRFVRSAALRHAGHSIGLALQEPLSVTEASDGCFAAGEVYTVRVPDSRGAAIVSTMIAITQDGHKVLWRGADA